jgi:hypothetical protein
LFCNAGPFGYSLALALWKELRTPPRLDVTDETVYDFAARRFGRDVADMLITAMVCKPEIMFIGDI